MSDTLLENIQQYFPYYLTAADKRDLYAEIRRFPNNKEFYLANIYQNKTLQGDGWRSFVLANIESSEKKSISGVVVSNSCDIDPDNGLREGQKILFAPLIRLLKYTEEMHRQGVSQQEIERNLDNIRKQCISHVFYLPEWTGYLDESIVMLDDINSNPLSCFLEQRPQKIFCLNQFAHYLFLIKISIHFTRLREGLRRYPDATNTAG